MILTENRKGQIESEVEIKDLIGPGMRNIEVPGLAKEVQPMVTVAVSFTNLVDWNRQKESKAERRETNSPWVMWKTNKALE